MQFERNVNSKTNDVQTSRTHDNDKKDFTHPKGD
jgi:hypothetical protein